MEAYEKFRHIRELMNSEGGADKILDSIEQVLSTDQLDDLAENLKSEFDIDYWPDEEPDDEDSEDR